MSQIARTTDRTPAKRRLADELENASKLDVKVGQVSFFLRFHNLRLKIHNKGRAAP